MSYLSQILCPKKSSHTQHRQATKQLFMGVGIATLSLSSISVQANSQIGKPVYDNTFIQKILPLYQQTPSQTNHQSFNQSASAQERLNQWLNLAQQQDLANHIIWRRLLYYPDNKSSEQSQVPNADFFISPEGRYNPKAELIATLTALVQTDNSKATQNIMCRFPARIHWLKTQLNIQESQLPKADCPEFDKWFHNLDPEQLSVVFAEEFPDNPPSAFAHTLLRIDSKTSLAQHNDKTAHALNYTVDGNAKDPFIKYLINSIDGGYPAMMTIDPYPKIIKKYLQKDGRDIWLYRLNLSPDDVRQIMRHVWEVKDLKLPYYFLTDNCSSEILRLIDIVRPTESLFKEVTYTAIPSDIIRLLEKQQFISQSKYVPAKPSIQQHARYQNMADNNQATLTQNPTTNRHDIYNFAPADNNPLTGVPVRRVMLGIGQNADNRYLEIGLRASYHDMLDNPSGVRQFLDLQGVDGKIRISQQPQDSSKNNKTKLSLQELTILQARIFNPTNTARKGKSWGGHVRLTQAQDGSNPDDHIDQTHLVASAGAEYGKSWAFGNTDKKTGQLPSQLCYTLATGTGQVGTGLNNYLRMGIGANIGCVYHFNNHLRTQAELQLPYWYHGGKYHYWQPTAKIGIQYDLKNNQAIRLQANQQWNNPQNNNDPQNPKQEKRDIQLSWVAYF